MTRKEQDALADVIATQWRYNTTTYGGVPVSRNAVSRLAQSIADKLGSTTFPVGKFDRARFVERAGFSHLEGF